MTARPQRDALKALVGSAIVLLSLKASAQQPAPLATVVNSSGPVTVRRARQQLTVDVGLKLIAGDVLTTGRGGQAWLVRQSGKVQKVGARARLVLRPGKARKRPSALAALLRRLGLLGGSDGGRLGNAGGGIRPAGEQRFLVLAPRRSTVRTPVPELSWTPLAGAARYRVQLSSVAQELLQRNVKQPRLAAAELAGKLSPGQVYFVSVEARSAKGRPLAKDQTTFTVASSQSQNELDQLAAELKRGVADRFSYRLLLAELYRRKSFYTEALAILEQLHRERASSWIKARIKLVRRLVGLPPALDKS